MLCGDRLTKGDRSLLIRCGVEPELFCICCNRNQYERWGIRYFPLLRVLVGYLGVLLLTSTATPHNNKNQKHPTGICKVLEGANF